MTSSEILSVEGMTEVLKQRDPLLAAWMARVGPCGLTQRALHSPFEALAESILHQQLAGAAARTIVSRVKALVGDPLVPEQMLRMDVAALRAVGVSGNKAKALLDLAARTQTGTVPHRSEDLATWDDDTIVKTYTQVFGIGRWTVEMLLLFRLGRLDVLPVDDYALRKGFATVYGGALPTPTHMRAQGERWRPYRSIASWYLWRISEL